MSGKAAIGKGKGKGKKKEGEEAVKGVAIATGVKWSGDKKPTADSQYRRSELGRNAHFLYSQVSRSFWLGWFSRSSGLYS